MLWTTRAMARFRALLLAAMTLPACLGFAASADAATVVASAQGETFTSTSSAVTPFSDGGAEGGQTLAIFANVFASKTLTLPGPVTGLAVRVRGTACQGVPNLEVRVDGISVMSVPVTATTYTVSSADKALASGTHTVSLALTNDYSVQGTCDRNLFVDRVDFTDNGTVATTTPTRPKLRWTPPALTAGTTINVAQGDQSYSLDPAKDYVLKLPTDQAHLGGINLTGGRNIVMIGGTIGIPASSMRKAALSIKDATGTVHVEGVLFDGTMGHEMDAIQVISPKAVVQVENVRAAGLRGSMNGNHSDVIQPWGGVSALRIDRLSGDSNYQGLFTRPDQGAIGSVTAQNVDLAFNDAGTTAGGYMIWMTTGCSMAPTSFTNVYVKPGSTRTLGNSVWPATTDSRCPAKVSGSSVSWPKLPVTGTVTSGVPSGGAFVPAGVAGPSYVSPGYA